MIWLLGCLILLGVGCIGFWIMFKIADWLLPENLVKR